jgi:hypothetical protein
MEFTSHQREPSYGMDDLGFYDEILLDRSGGQPFHVGFERYGQKTLVNEYRLSHDFIECTSDESAVGCSWEICMIFSHFAGGYEASRSAFLI